MSNQDMGPGLSQVDTLWRRLISIGLLIGSAPLALGVGIFLLWSITREEIYVAAAMGLIYAAVPLNILCLGGLLYFGFQHRRAGLIEPLTRMKAIVTSVLLGLNYPTAALLLIAAQGIMASVDVRIDNASGQAAFLTVIGPDGHEHELGDLEDGQVRIERLRFNGEGSVRLRVKASEREQESIIIPYSAAGANPPRIQVRVQPNLSVE